MSSPLQSNLPVALGKKYAYYFLLFDRDCDDHIEASELGVLVRSLGYFPTNAEVQNMLDTVADPDRSGLVTKNNFLRLMGQLYVESRRNGGGGPARWSRLSLGGETAGQLLDSGCSGVDEEELREAFRVFDKGTESYIDAAELRYVLTSLGDQITEAQADEILQDAEIDSEGQINYEELLRKMLYSYNLS